MSNENNLKQIDPFSYCNNKHCKSTIYQPYHNKFCIECGNKISHIDERYIRIFKVCSNKSCENFDQEILLEENYCRYCSNKLLLLGESKPKDLRKIDKKAYSKKINNKQDTNHGPPDKYIIKFKCTKWGLSGKNVSRTKYTQSKIFIIPRHTKTMQEKCNGCGRNMKIKIRSQRAQKNFDRFVFYPASLVSLATIIWFFTFGFWPGFIALLFIGGGLVTLSEQRKFRLDSDHELESVKKLTKAEVLQMLTIRQ